MEKRILGKTGEHLSVVGFGGIVVMNEEQATANRLVTQAIDRGINYFDVAPVYGNAEERLGPALEPYRHSIFLACKTTERSKDKAMADLYQSLKRMRTDHFDLYQLHGLSNLEEVQQVMASNGAIEACLEARERGIIRYIGFSAHSEEAALALLNRFEFDSILFPFNWVCWYQGNFGPRILQKAQEKGIGILALKALAKRKVIEGEERKWPKCWYIPVDNFEEASLALRFTLSKPITSAVSSSHTELLWWACDAAELVTPLSDKESEQLSARSKELEPIFPQ